MSEYNEIMKNAKGHSKKYAAFDPNKQKKTIIKLVIALVVALVVLVSILKMDEIKNLIKTSSVDPTKHYLEIENKYIEKRLGEYSNFVNSYNKKIESQPNNRQILARLDADQGLLQAFKNKGLDTHGATSVEIGIDTSKNEDGNSFFFSSKINDTEFFDASYFQAKDDKPDYAKVTQISDCFLQIDKNNNAGNLLGGVSVGSAMSAVGNTDILTSLLAGENLTDNTETYKKLLNIYTDFVKEKKLANRRSESKSVNGMDNSYNMFTINMDGGQVCELAIKYLEAAKSDENIKNIVFSKVKDVEDLVGMDAAVIYAVNGSEPTVDTYIQNFKDAKKSAESYAKTLVVTMYADIKDNPLGHSIELKRETKQVMFLESILAMKNGRFAYSLQYKKDGEEIASLKGHGAANFVSTSGTATFMVGKGSNKIVIKASLDGANTSNLKNGLYNGKISFASNDLYPNGKMVADVDWNLDSIKINSTLYENGQSTGMFSLSSLPLDSPTNTKPTENDKVIKVSDSKAMNKYMEGFNLEKYLNKFFKKAGIDMRYEDIPSLLKKINN